MELFELPSPRITFIDLPALDLQRQESMAVRAELDVAPSDAWLEQFRTALVSGSELFVQAAPRVIGSCIEFDSLPAAARELCDELRAWVDITTQKLPG